MPDTDTTDPPADLTDAELANEAIALLDGRRLTTAEATRLYALQFAARERGIDDPIDQHVTRAAVAALDGRSGR